MGKPSSGIATWLNVKAGWEQFQFYLCCEKAERILDSEVAQARVRKLEVLLSDRSDELTEIVLGKIKNKLKLTTLLGSVTERSQEFDDLLDYSVTRMVIENRNMIDENFDFVSEFQKKTSGLPETFQEVQVKAW